MKRIIGLSTLVALALILWGLVKSPQLLLEIKEKSRELAGTSVSAPEKESLPPQSSEELAREIKKFEALMTELDSLRTDYQSSLQEYKQLDSEFTQLVMKSRENPNRALIQKRQAELDEKFEALTQSLRIYQTKSQEIYQFQKTNLSTKGV